MLTDHHLESDILDHIRNERQRNRGIAQCDLGYLALYDPKDLPKFTRFTDYVKTCREVGKLDQKNKLIEYFEQYLSRTYNDQTVDYSGLLPEPLHVGFKPDRVVFTGLERIADLVTGKSSLVFNFYGVGTGSTPVLPSNVGLDFEEHRVSISSTGFSESKGSSMVFAAHFPTTLPSMIVTESAIFDRLINPAVMMLRTVYSGANVVNHIFNQTFVAVSHFIYQLSI